MPKQSSFNKIMTSAVVFSLLAGTAAYAESAPGTTSAVTAADQGTGRLTTPFSDVKEGHWAEKHIAKLALQGIIKGYDNGEFRPNDNVTQQEAVVMALRFMGKDGEVSKAGGVVFPEAFQVGDSYKAYILLAFDAGLLDSKEEFKEAETDTKTEWGLRKASREWITKLVIRAIGQKAKADAMAETSSAFTDQDSIDSGYLGYVNAAADLQLVNGVSAGKFDPKGLVTRAALATIFSRAESQTNVQYAGQTSGIISALGSNSISLYGENGKETVYTIGADTLFARFDSEKMSALSGIEPYTDAKVITKDGKALYIEQLGSEAKVKTVSGIFQSAVPDKHLLWLKVDDGYSSVQYNDSLVVKDSTGAVIPVAQLTADSTIEVSQDTFRSTPLAVSIQVKGAPVNKTGTGKFVKAEAGKVTILENGAADAQTWDVAPDAIVTWQNTVSALTDIKAGDSVTYEVANSIITKISIVQSSGRTVSGQFGSISSDGKTITYFVNGAPEAKFLATNAVVTIEGIASAAFSDLYADDQVELTINDADQVSSVKVLDRKLEFMTGATISTYVPETKILTVVDTSGKPHALLLSAKTKIDMNGTAFSLETAAGLLLANKKVTVGYVDSDAISLQFAYKYTGTLMNINLVTNEVTLSVANGSTLVLPIQTPAVEIYGKASSTLSDLKTGDKITAILNASQDAASILQVNTTVQQTVAAVDTVGKKVKLTSADGVTTEWTVGSDWSITNESGANLTLGNLPVGQAVNVVFAGKQPAALQAINITIGKVAAVVADHITVTDYSGKTSDLTLGTTFHVIQGGISSTSLAALKVGDRVDVRKDEQGNVMITINEGLARTFWKYDAAAHIIYVTRATVNDNNMFTVASDTFINQNGTAIPVTSLNNGDKIVLYQFNGKLEEVAKQ